MFGGHREAGSLRCLEIGGSTGLGFLWLPLFVCLIVFSFFSSFFLSGEKMLYTTVL
jgi:hypothetical protein